MVRKIVAFPGGRRLRSARKRELGAQITKTTRLLERALRELTRPVETERGLKTLLPLTLTLMLRAAELRLHVQGQLEEGPRRPQD